MTTLNSIGSAEPEPGEVADASLAMADYDAKAGDYAAALEWLAVAARFRVLTPEYRHKKVAWEFSTGLCDGTRMPLPRPNVTNARCTTKSATTSGTSRSNASLTPALRVGRTHECWLE
jgi:hypothetical protein